MLNEATWTKSSSKDEKLNQLWKGITEIKEAMLIQNKKLDKLTTIENKLVGRQADFCFLNHLIA